MGWLLGKHIDFCMRLCFSFLNFFPLPEQTKLDKL